MLCIHSINGLIGPHTDARKKNTIISGDYNKYSIYSVHYPLQNESDSLKL